VSVALAIRHEKRIRHIVICDPSGSTVFFYVISQTARFSIKVTERKMCVLISVQILSEAFSILRLIERDDKCLYVLI
jgi:hypothetical protein